MFGGINWAAPVVAIALLWSLQPSARAADAEAGANGTVSGKVVDKEGKAVSGATVRLMKPFEGGRRQRPQGNRAAGNGQAQQLAEEPAPPQRPDHPRRGKRPKPVATATTDAEGKFTLNDVPAGEYVVMAMVRGQGAARQPVNIKAGETASVDLKLQPRAARPGGPGGPGGPGAGERPRRPQPGAGAE